MTSWASSPTTASSTSSRTRWLTWPFPDGEQISQWLDLDRTCEEIARFSVRDAEAYRRMVSEYDEVKQIYGRSRVTPPGFGPTLEEMLLEHPRDASGCGATRSAPGT